MIYNIVYDILYIIYSMLYIIPFTLCTFESYINSTSNLFYYIQCVLYIYIKLYIITYIIFI